MPELPEEGLPRRQHMKQQRMPAPDMLRAMAALGVVAQHILGAYARRVGSPVPTEGADSLALRGIALAFETVRFAVPAFFFLAGMMSARKPPEAFSYGDTLKKRGRTIALPYFFWTLLYLWDSGGEMGPGQILTALLSGDAAYHLWYVPVVLQFALVSFAFAAIRKWGDRARCPGLFWGAALGLAYLLMIVTGKYPHLFTAWVFYYLLGCLCGTRMEAFSAFAKRFWPAFGLLWTLGTCFVVQEDFQWIRNTGAVNFSVVHLGDWDYAPLVFAAILCLWVLGDRLASVSALRQAGTFLGVHSYRFYLIHVMAINHLNRRLVGYFADFKLYYSLLFCLVVLCSLAAAFALDSLEKKLRSRRRPAGA